jgi:hypothetical protein
MIYLSCKAGYGVVSDTILLDEKPTVCRTDSQQIQGRRRDTAMSRYNTKYASQVANYLLFTLALAAALAIVASLLIQAIIFLQWNPIIVWASLPIAGLVTVFKAVVHGIKHRVAHLEQERA